MVVDKEGLGLILPYISAFLARFKYGCGPQDLVPFRYFPTNTSKKLLPGSN